MDALVTRQDRLDKFIAHHAGLSRAEAKRAIHAGAVQVDGVPITDTGFKPAPGAAVTLDGTPVTASGPLYLMLNKPAGWVCDREDGHHRSLFDAIDHPRQAHLHVAGRLDVDTTGLVLLTDDGEWSHRITAPRHKQPKQYHVITAHPVGAEAEGLFRQGVLLRGEDSPTLPATLTVTGSHAAVLTLQEGRYHQVKRMFAAIGNQVVGLHRSAIGHLHLPADLAPGTWRALTPDERLQAEGKA
jgi:16S rRNA pseudouridine516 synthase